VSKNHHKWVCFYLQEFDTEQCSNKYLPICQNIFPNIISLKTQFADDNINNFWTTIPKAYPRLLVLDIDFTNSRFCPAKLLDWIRLSPDEFITSNSNNDPYIGQTGRSIQHLILRNKAGDNRDCQLRYGLLQISELTLYNCLFTDLVYKSLMKITQLKTVNITIILPDNGDIHIITEAVNIRRDIQFNIRLFFRSVFNPESVRNLEYIDEDRRPNVNLKITRW